MTTPLERVLEQLSLEFGIEAPERLVTRVDSRPARGAGNGAGNGTVNAAHCLTLELETDGGNRWFRLADGALSELEPRADRKLPLTARWTALAAEGPIELLAWRPGRRMALMHGRAGGDVVVKAMRKGRVERAAAMHRLAADALGTDRVRAPALLATDTRSESLVLERELGGAFALGSESVDGFFEIGAALRRLQAARPTLDLPLHGPADELVVLDGWVEKAERWTGGRPAGWQALRDELASRPLPAPSAGLVLAHRDLHDGQFVATPSGIVLLDFDLLCLADPVLDAANLTAHLSLRVLQGLLGASEASAAACGAALMAGLDRGSADTAAFRFYLAATYLRLAALYGLRPRWAHLGAELVVRAREALGSGIRA